jgi:small subunit ribosomal protein S3
MGQKVNPIGLRLGINKTWDSKWFVGDKKAYAKNVHEDIAIRKQIDKSLQNAGIAKIEIQRTNNQVIVNIHTSKPGVIIGGQGKKIEELRDALTQNFKHQFNVNVVEIKPQLNAALVSESIAKQVESRVSYRRAVKMAIDKAIESGALGVKVKVAGRLNGVEIARSEFFSKGKIPLHTLRADIDYSVFTANTTYGTIGVKTWIYKGDVFN